MSNLALNLVASGFVKGRVAAYEYPRRIWFVDSLPTGPTGKLLLRKVTPPTEEAWSAW
jgi:long-chain acyl-CoA synthetase